jgi:uncharacterized protein
VPTRQSLWRLLPFIVPPLVVWTGWLALMLTSGRWELFASGWHMSLTMAIGSFIAGATSEGGGAVAFPVMTLVFQVSPQVARDFSLMIQSVGMNSAAFTIFTLRIPIEWRALIFAGLGGAFGVIVGLEFLVLPPAFAKMLFVSTWLAFAVALYWINRYREREVRLHIEAFGARHALMLATTGLIGGLVTSVTGSGLDICTFALLVLRLRICEKIATPTSVVLMGMNSAVAFAYKHHFIVGGMAAQAWEYWWVCVPVVTLGAPLGAWFIRDKSRYFVANILYVSIALQFGWAIYVLEVLSRPGLAAFSTATFLTGAGLFWYMAKRGVRRLNWLAKRGG